MKRKNKSLDNESRNGRNIVVGSMIQECNAKYVGRVVAVDGGALLYRPFGGQEIIDTGFANCNECIVLTEPQK